MARSPAESKRPSLPPVISGLWVWFLLPAAVTFVIPLAALFPAVRSAVATPSPWVWFGLPVLTSIPTALAIFMVWRRLRAVKLVVRAADGRACLRCAHDLNGLRATGVCPECSAPFDIEETRQTWVRIKMLP